MWFKGLASRAMLVTPAAAAAAAAALVLRASADNVDCRRSELRTYSLLWGPSQLVPWNPSTEM